MRGGKGTRAPEVVDHVKEVLGIEHIFAHHKHADVVGCVLTHRLPNGLQVVGTDNSEVGFRQIDADESKVGEFHRRDSG